MPMPNFDPRNPDTNLVVVFSNHAVKNVSKSAAEGRPMFDDMEVCTIRAAGSRNTTIQPASAVSHWIEDPLTGDQRTITYAERFSVQYRQFKERQSQTMMGTPIDYATFLTEGERATLRALNLYTVEQLAAIDGQELKNLGPGGRAWKNRAEEFIATAKLNAVDTQMHHDNEALRARVAVLEENTAALEAKNAQLAASVSSSANGEGQFAEMSDEQVREYIKTHAGHAPQGNLNRKVLVHMALGLQPKAA